MKRYWCYYTSSMGYDYEAFPEERDDGEWIKFSDHAALLRAVAEVIRHKGHDADCPAVICGRGTCRGHKDKPYHFPSVDPDDWCSFVSSGPCSESCGHDRALAMLEVKP